jgi:hypothetical protein
VISALERKAIRQRHSSAAVPLGAVGLLFFGALFTLGAPVVGVPLLLGGVGALWYGKVQRDHRVTNELLATSFRAITLGKLGDALEYVEEAERSRAPWVRRIADVQRAIIALRKGDPKEARAQLDMAIARPLGLREKENAVFQIEAAHALRAFARASLGDSEGAFADIALLRARPGASAESLARASLAEAIVLERTGERDRLRALLDRDKLLLLENCHPRERAIVRAFQRMVRAATTSAYRQSAPRETEETRDEPPLVDWVAKVAPSAAPFVRVARPGEASGPRVGALPESAFDARDKVLASRDVGAAVTGKTTVKARWLSILGISAAALLGFVGLIALLISFTPAINAPYVAEATPPPMIDMQVAVVAVTLLLGAVGLGAGGVHFRNRLKRASREELGRLAAARAALGRGDLDEATRAIAPLIESQHDVIAGHAHALNTSIAERRGDAQAMLASASWGLGRLSRAQGHAAAALRPELMAQRALALTLLDRRDEAAAELNFLTAGAYPTWERDLFRVRLVDLARAGRFDEAARWVAQNRGDLPLSVRDELLADLVRAVNAPESAGLGEMERLKDELRTEPAHRRWIELVAPRVLDAFRWASEGGSEEDASEARLRIAGGGEEGDAEREAQAEAEQAREGASRTRQRRS